MIAAFPSEYEYEIRSDIKPSEIDLLPENWRTNPDKDIDDLIKSISQLGLFQPPIIALYKNPKNSKKGVALDGNRRTLAGQKLENGYKTKLNEMKVTLHLPENWRFAIHPTPYEDLSQEEMDRIRLHSTEQHKHFTMAELKSRINRVAEKYCTDRDLAYSTIRKNRTLYEEMVSSLAVYFLIEKTEIIKILRETQTSPTFDKRFDEPLHFRDITINEAKALSMGVNDAYVEPLLAELIKVKKDGGYSETQTVPAIYATKELLTDLNKDAVTIFKKQLNKIEMSKKLTIDTPLELYNKITEQRTKANITLADLIIPILEKAFN